jgi:hypothetical protein
MRLPWGQRHCASWLYHGPDGYLLVNVAVFTPPELRWRYGMRWADLRVVSVHRVTESGLRQLEQVEWVLQNLRMAVGTRGKVVRALRKWFSLGDAAVYEATGFVLRDPEAFPPASLDDGAVRRVVRRVYGGDIYPLSPRDVPDTTVLEEHQAYHGTGA